jgi:hypothetical protein
MASPLAATLLHAGTSASAAFVAAAAALVKDKYPTLTHVQVCGVWVRWGGVAGGPLWSSWPSAAAAA